MKKHFMCWGIGGAQMAFRLAQHRTHSSSLAVPLQKRFRKHDKPSSYYYGIVRDVEMLNAAWPYDGRSVVIWLDGPIMRDWVVP